MRTFLAAGLLVTNSLALAETPPPWAYGFADAVPANWSPPHDPAPAAPAPPPDPTTYTLPGSKLKFTRAQITDIFGPADFYPDDHAVPPSIVSHGKPPVVWACARCHYANGKGRPENAGIAALPVEYFIEQLQAFRAGDRRSSDPRKPNTKMMADFAQGMTDEEIRDAAVYYGAMKRTPWIRVVETERVPQTTISAGMFLQVPNGGDEPIGGRIIEVPEDANAVEITRSTRAGFIAYVPIGSVKRGEILVTTGGEKTVACATCHGSDLEGLAVSANGPVPGLAGRSPSYLVRQLFDMKTGQRRGTRVELMKPVVANLTTDDLRDIAAYLASLK